MNFYQYRNPSVNSLEPLIRGKKKEKKFMLHHISEALEQRSSQAMYAPVV